MALFKSSKLAVRCPLCLEWMNTMFVPERRLFVHVCHTDKVFISTEDPLVNRWETDGHEKIECPNCNAYMRVFFNSAGFMKAKCPKKKCGCTIQGSNPDIVTGDRPALKTDGLPS